MQTIADLFYGALRYELPDALAHKRGGAYQPLSHAQIRAAVEALALALHAHGLRPGDRVAILSENRPEWAIADYACAISGLVTVPVYPTLNGEQTALILRHRGARWVICSSAEQLAKVWEQWPGLPDEDVKPAASANRTERVDAFACRRDRVGTGFAR